MRVYFPGVTNQEADDGHGDHEVGLDYVLRVTEPPQPGGVLQSQDPAELYLLVHLHNNSTRRISIPKLKALSQAKS